MGLFGSSQQKKEDPINDLLKKIFPNGISDINDGTDELLRILNNGVQRQTAQDIFVKSFARSTMDTNFDLNDLKIHHDGYCKGIFSPSQLQQLLDYLTARKLALLFGGKKVFKDKNGNYCVN